MLYIYWQQFNFKSTASNGSGGANAINNNSLIKKSPQGAAGIIINKY